MLYCNKVRDNIAEAVLPSQTMVVGPSSPPKHVLLCSRAVSGVVEAALGGHSLPDYAGWGWRECWQPVCHQSDQGLGMLVTKLVV